MVETRLSNSNISTTAPKPSSYREAVVSTTTTSDPELTDEGLILKRTTVRKFPEKQVGPNQVQQTIQTIEEEEIVPLDKEEVVITKNDKSSQQVATGTTEDVLLLPSEVQVARWGRRLFNLLTMLLLLSLPIALHTYFYKHQPVQVELDHKYEMNLIPKAPITAPLRVFKPISIDLERESRFPLVRTYKVENGVRTEKWNVPIRSTHFHRVGISAVTNGTDGFRLYGSVLYLDEVNWGIKQYFSKQNGQSVMAKPSLFTRISVLDFSLGDNRFWSSASVFKPQFVSNYISIPFELVLNPERIDLNPTSLRFDLVITDHLEGFDVETEISEIYSFPHSMVCCEDGKFIRELEARSQLLLRTDTLLFKGEQDRIYKNTIEFEQGNNRRTFVFGH